MDGTWVVRVWNGYGTGSGTKRPTPAQLCHHEAHLYQNWQCGARVAQQAILRLLACQLATAKRISTIKHHSCATAGSNCKWCRRKTCHRLRGREGYKQSILRLPADNSQAHPYHHTTNAAGTDLPTQSQGLGIVNLFLHVHTHVCMCAQVCAYKCKIRLHIFRCIYIYINTYIYIYIITYGSEVWNRGMERILQGGMERGYGTGVVPELVPDLLFWLAPISVWFNTFKILHTCKFIPNTG